MTTETDTFRDIDKNVFLLNVNNFFEPFNQFIVICAVLTQGPQLLFKLYIFDEF
jgi:hypothetical protein